MTDEERYLELYKPEKLKLTGGPSEVRLIDIQPGALSEPLSITLERHIIRSTNDYIALSYHWGDPKEARVKVPCNGLDIAITRNLHEALTYIRMPHNPVRIWADALCINQQDDQEKNVQVGRMDQIYQRASCVVVWLGLPADDSDLVFQMARTVRPRIEKIDRESYTDRQARAVDALKRRHWFNRIWVVQEYALAREVLFQCGHERVEGHKMRQVLDTTAVKDTRLLDGTIEINVRHEARQTPSCLFEFKPGGLEDGLDKHDLLGLLSLFQKLDATDPKDKVYALLNIVRRGGRQPLVDIPLRYEKSVSVADVYTDAAFRIISTTGTLDIFSSLLPRRWPLPGEENPVILPSWVVDWRRPENGYLHIPVIQDWYLWGAVMPNGKDNHFRATGTSIAAPSPSSSSSMICLSGYPFDDIMYLAPIMPPESAFQSYDHYMHILCQWDQLAFPPTQDPNQAYPTGEDAATAFWKVIWSELFTGPRRDWVPTEVAKYRQKLWELRRNGIAVTHRGGLFSAPRTVNTAGFIKDDKIAPGICRLAHYALARTRRGFLAAVPAATRVGDTVALLAGGKVPLILRRQGGEGSYWTVVGETYVHGLMLGEAWNPALCLPMPLL